jgi:integrase/recombinase XerD
MTTDSLDFFLDYLTFERGLSQSSVQVYLQAVERFVEWAEVEGIEDLATLRHPEIRQYLFHLKDLGRAASTVRVSLSAIRAYYGFLLDEGQIEVDPTEPLESPRPGRSLPDALSMEEVLALLEAPDESRATYWRDRAILELLYATGIRVSELTGLRLSDIDFEERSIRVLGKGDKERIVPFGEAASGALERYLRELRPRHDTGASGGHVFLNPRGRGLTRMSVYTTVRESARRAGIERRVSPHTLRHTFATHLLQGGADLTVVQELLGHADISTTQIYTHLDREHLRKAHRKYHPRA